VIDRLIDARGKLLEWMRCRDNNQARLTQGDVLREWNAALSDLDNALGGRS
jgi:hypothetical protein